MQENKPIYEITRLMTDRSAVKKDMDEAMDLVKKMFMERYFTKINKTMEVYQKQSSQNPPKEAVLLKAFKPFMHPSAHPQIDNMVNTISMYNVFSNIQSELNEIKPQRKVEPQNIVSKEAKDSSVHEDGIYDVDSACISGKNSAINTPDTRLALLIAMLIGSMKPTR